MELKWLDKDQRTFLERGYLKPGITPEERYRKIAYTIERISGIEGIEKKIYKIHREWLG